MGKLKYRIRKRTDTENGTFFYIEYQYRVLWIFPVWFTHTYSNVDEPMQYETIEDAERAIRDMKRDEAKNEILKDEFIKEL